MAVILVAMATRTTAILRRWARNEVVTRKRLTALGLTRGEIRSLVRRELLFPAHTGVFFLVADPSRLSQWTAAVARGGDRAALSHFSAAALWRLVSYDRGFPHVMVPRVNANRIDGVHLHRTRRPFERCERQLVPVTSLHRTIDDCARSLPDKRIKSLLRQAEYHHPIDLRALAAEATSGRLARVLRLYLPGQGRTDSELEADFFELSHAAGLPTPELQRPIPGGRADFVYESLKLIAEVDGFGGHGGRVAFREDRARDRANRARGYDTLRFTWEDVQTAPAAVVRDLASEASRRSMLSSAAS